MYVIYVNTHVSIYQSPSAYFYTNLAFDIYGSILLCSTKILENASYLCLKHILISLSEMHTIPFLGCITISLTYSLMMDSGFSIFYY